MSKSINDAQLLALKQLNVRLEPAMGAYLAARLAAGEALASISVMGVDAKTGLPVRIPSRTLPVAPVKIPASSGAPVSE